MTTKALGVYELLGKRILVTRESARKIQGELAAILCQSPGEVELDFHGIEGLTPSFLDETLSVIEESIRESDSSALRVVIKNPPTHLSSKFAAVARGHKLVIVESNEGNWIISRERK